MQKTKYTVKNCHVNIKNKKKKNQTKFGKNVYLGMSLDLRLLKSATLGSGIFSVIIGILCITFEVQEQFVKHFISKFPIIVIVFIHELNSICVFIGVLSVSTFIHSKT